MTPMKLKRYVFYDSDRGFLQCDDLGGPYDPVPAEMQRGLPRGYLTDTLKISSTFVAGDWRHIFRGGGCL